MRILLLTQWFQPEPFFKGLPFAKELSARGHTVEVLTGFPNYPGGELYPGYRVRLWQRDVMDDIRVNRVALYPSHDRSGLLRIFNYLSFAFACLLLGPWLVRRADVIYVYNLVTLGPAAFLLRFIFGAKVLIDVQDLWPESVLNSGMMSEGLAHRLLTPFCNWTYRQADWVTVLSPGFRRTLARRSVDPERIEVIYNWCDESSQSRVPPSRALAEELKLVGRFNVLFAGTMGVAQGLDTVLDAASLCTRHVPEVQFVLIGGGVERARLEAKATEMGLTNVVFLPRREPQMMGPIYALADALLVHLQDDPLFRITIPSKTQTYLHMGKPIIMAVRGDAAKLLEEACAGLVCPPEDPVALAQTVSELFSLSAEERERMVGAGRKFYATTLAMAVGVDRFEQRMRKLVGQGAQVSE